MILIPVRIPGPDDQVYDVVLSENKEIENILSNCFNIKIRVYEGNFPWIKKGIFGYAVHLEKGKKGWKRFKTAVRGGFCAGGNAYIDSKLPLEEKLAIVLHEAVHIIEHHQEEEGKNLPLEKHTTERALKLVKENADCLKKHSINPNKIVNALSARLTTYRKNI